MDVKGRNSSKIIKYEEVHMLHYEYHHCPCANIHVFAHFPPLNAKSHYTVQYIQKGRFKNTFKLLQISSNF